MSLIQFLAFLGVLTGLIALIALVIIPAVTGHLECHAYDISNGTYRYSVDAYNESNGSVSFTYGGQLITMTGNYIIWTNNCSGEVSR